MNNDIIRSVGLNGANEKSDVKFIQYALNFYVDFHKSTLSVLNVDGICGSKTIGAIKTFQKDYVGIKSPDGRVDPNGKTLRYLTMYLSNKNKNYKIQEPLKKEYRLVGLDGINVSYSADIKKERRIVSLYAINVIKIALKECGMNHAVITSTLRTPEDQAEIMYRHAKVNVLKQKSLYGRNGDEVLDVFISNETKNKDEIINLMKEKIESLMAKNRIVSNHCSTIENFSKKNIFDIGVRSTESLSKNFDKEKLTQAFKDLARQGYIKNFIDETMKSNNCWHIEIVPNGKNLNAYGKESILWPTKYIAGTYV